MSVHSGGTKGVVTDQLPGGQIFECYHCWYKTKNKLSLEDHMRIAHLVERPHACDKCDFRAIKKSHLLQHKKVHVLNVYGCSLCDFKSYERESVKRHLRIHNNATPLYCKMCDHKALNQLALANHTKTHEKNCNQCDYKANDCSDLKDHMNIHVGEKLLSCNNCNYTSSSKDAIRHHMKRHAGEKPLKACNYCDYRTKDQSSLRTHLTIHTGEKPYKCSYCDYCTNDRDCLTSHVATHTGAKSFPCDICEFKTTCRNNLRKHKKLTHSAYKPYKCELCDFKSATEPALRSHKLVHLGERPFACNLCDYTSYNKSNVVAHKKIHTGDNGVTCTYCPYTAKKTSDVRRHIMKVHSTEKKRFKCKECSYRTADKKSMKKHKRVHTGQKPFACTVCDKTYNRRPTLQDHVVKIHTRLEDEGSYVCSICDGNAQACRSTKAVDVAKHILSCHTTADVPAATVESAQPVETAIPVLLDNVDYVCNMCAHKANNVTDMAKHMLTAHSATEATATMVVTADSPMLRSFLTSDVSEAQFDPV